MRDFVRPLVRTLALAGALAGAALAARAQPATPAARPPVPAPAPGAAPAPAADAASAAAEDRAATLAQSSVRWTLAIEAPEALRDLLAGHLDLARYAQAATGERTTRAELARLVDAAPDQVRALLETEGYFDPAAVDLRVAAPDTDGLTRLTLGVQPGPRTRVERVRLEFEGPLSVAADAGEPEAVQLVARLREAWSLPRGQAYSQDAWAGAKNGVIGSLRAQGYTAAVFSGTSARVEVPRASATLYLVVDSGPLARFGATRFEGLQHVRESDLRALIQYAPGDALREQVLLDFQDRLVKTTLFDAVAVTVEPEEGREGATPVLVRLRERSMHQATVGVGVSEATGPRVTFEHLHQQVFGLAWQAKTRLQLGRTEQTAALDLLSHPKPGPYRNLIAGSVVRTEASGLIVSSQKARIGRTQDTERIDRLFYFEGLRDSTRADDGSTPTDTISSLTANYGWVWRDLDDPVLPTRGTGFSADVGAGRSFHSAGDSGWFARATGRVTHYWPFGTQWYGQARVQAGQVFAPARITVPYTLLFRAGGDESVRGYDYQAIGPLNAAGDAVGGRVLGTASLELARPISPKLSSFWLAGFVDAGDAAASWSALRPKLGYGVGLRWRSPVGALKLDLAYGDAVRKFRLHFTVGVTF